MQNTKWETVSAGSVKFTSPAKKFESGPFFQTITLSYMDWATMEHNRRLLPPRPDIIQREEFELMESKIMTSKSKHKSQG